MKEERKGKDLTVMMCATISARGKGGIFVMKRNPKSKKNRYSAESYVSALKELIL